jgi:hypothetical protein
MAFCQRGSPVISERKSQNRASYPKVSLALGFKNPTQEDSYRQSATPEIYDPSI